MSIVLSYLKTFLILLVELSLLFIVISFIVSWLQRVVSEERIQKLLNRPSRWAGYIYGTLLGTLTPFCSCSTIPVLAGLISSKAPFGPSVSFLIASPLLNPVIVIMLWAMFGWEFTLYYTIAIFILAIVTGWGWQHLGLQKFVKEIRVKRNSTSKGKSFTWKTALQDARDFFYSVFPYLVIGVAIGAAIYNFVPEELIATYAKGREWLTVPISAVIGIPMYVRVETILPISDALVSKGLNLGAVAALIIGGAGASIPEVILLNKLFKSKLIVAFVTTILLSAISIGYITQYLFGAVI